jgi:MoxR-like ATPase
MRDAARAHAFISGRAYVTVDDIQAVVKNILRHRLIPSYEAKADQIESAEIIEKILKLVPLPH